MYIKKYEFKLKQDKYVFQWIWWTAKTLRSRVSQYFNFKTIKTFNLFTTMQFCYNTIQQ